VDLLEGFELTKVRHIHSWDTLRNPLNIDFGINNERQHHTNEYFGINNERQHCTNEIGTVCGGE
jgi:hypothetical protein